MIRHIEPLGDGWVIVLDKAHVHLTADWADAIHRDQFEIHGHQNAALNRLRYELRHGSPTVEQVAEWFEDFYGELRRNREDRTRLGLKAVTRHGHEDLEAVRNGAPVRPWNAAHPNRELHDWIREQQREKS